MQLDDAATLLPAANAISLSVVPGLSDMHRLDPHMNEPIVFILGQV